jgi:conjugative transposon TraM protein
MGLNLELPDAKLPREETRDKLGFYNQAQEDSIRLRQEMLNDPYYKNRLDTSGVPLNFPLPPNDLSQASKRNPSPYHAGGSTISAEEKIQERLAAFTKMMNAPEGTRTADETSFTSGRVRTGDVERLESMMQVMNEKSGDDPEIKELNGMLEKILDVQHPERVKARTKEKWEASSVQKYSVSTSGGKSDVSFLGTRKDTGRQKENAFFGESFAAANTEAANTMAATVHGTQTITSGSTVKLRLLTDVYLNDVLIPKGTFLTGIASIEAERVLLHIPSLRYKNNFLPVSLKAYDMDGLQGIYVQGSVSRDVVKSSADQSLQSIDLISLDPSLKTQAANAGLQTAKGLLSKKVKQIKVRLKTGYLVFLKDSSKKENSFIH